MEQAIGNLKLKTDEIKHTQLKSKITKQKLLTELMQLKGDFKSSENYVCIIVITLFFILTVTKLALTNDNLKAI